MNEWAIIDDHGVIDKGRESDIIDLWWAYHHRPETMHAWEGDLLLVEIRDVHR